METVTGKLVSTKPISLSNAAKYVSRFNSSDNGASHAVGVYLHRASDSFNSLVQLQKKLKSHHSHGAGQASQPLNWDIKVETLDAADETPRLEKIKNSESRGKGKKNLEFELKNDVPLEINQDAVVVEEVKVKKSLENKGTEKKNQKEVSINNEEIVQIEQSEKKRNKIKKSGKERVMNDEPVVIEQDVEKKNQKVGVNNEETVQIEQSPNVVVEEKINKKKKSGKERVMNDETVVIEQDTDVVGEIKGEESSENKGKYQKNHKFGVKNEETLQIEQSPVVVVEKKKKKKFGKKKVMNDGSVVIEHDDDVVIKIKGEKSSENKPTDKKNQYLMLRMRRLLKLNKVQKGVMEKKEKSGKEKMKNDGPVKIELDADVAGEIKGEKILETVRIDKKNNKCDEMNKQTVQIEQTLDGVVEKRKKKKSGKDKGKKEEIIQVGRGADGEDAGEKVLDEGWVISKQENVEVEGDSVKRDKKKKRKKSECKGVEEIFKGEEGKQQECRKVDDGETIDLSEGSGKKKGRKGEGFDKTEQEIFEDGNMNEVGEVSVKRGEKKKKRKESEGKDGGEYYG